MTSPVDVAKLRALCDAATPGPWKWWTSNSRMRLTGSVGRDGGVIDGRSHPYDGVVDVQVLDVDADLIAAARTALPACLDEIERLREENIEQARCLLDPDATCCADASRVHREQRLEVKRLRAALTEALDGWQRYVRGHGASSDDDDIERLRKLVKP